MIAIVFKKSNLDRATSIIFSRPSIISSISSVEHVEDSVYFYFDSTDALSRVSTSLYVAGIVHRCVIR